MKRIITAALAASMLTLALVTVASAAKPDATGPRCADFEVDVAYSEDGSEILFLFTTQAPSCARLQYTGYVYSDSTAATAVSAFANGNGTTSVGVAVPSGDDAEVCVAAATTSSSGHVYDAAPNTGTCLVLTRGGTGALKMG